jgi:hypothetical protein
MKAKSTFLARNARGVTDFGAEQPPWPRVGLANARRSRQSQPQQAGHPVDRPQPATVMVRAISCPPREFDYSTIQ